MIYVVVKEGVYMQGTWGPFGSVQQACHAARKLAAADSDCYHGWVVYPISADGLGDELGKVRKTCEPTASCVERGYCGATSDLPE